MPGKTLPQEFADLAESFRSIAERSDALPSELKHAQERGGRLVDAAYRAGLIADESGLLEATQHLREPKHKDDEESRNWGTFWSLFVLNLSRIYRPGCSNPLAIVWGPESNGVRTGTTKTDEWRIRARKSAYVAGWLAEHLIPDGLTKVDGQADEARWLVGQLRDMSGIGRTNFAKYVKQAGCKTAGRGIKNHRYTDQEARKILECIRDNCTERRIRTKCIEALENHF